MRLPGQTRNWLPAWALMWLIVPPPFRWDFRLILWLQSSTSRMASVVLDVVGVRHLMEGNVLVLPGQRMLVEEACSGVNSLLVLLSVTALFVVAARRPLLWAGLLLASSVAWAWLANVARVDDRGAGAGVVPGGPVLRLAARTARLRRDCLGSVAPGQHRPLAGVSAATRGRWEGRIASRTSPQEDEPVVAGVELVRRPFEQPGSACGRRECLPGGAGHGRGAAVRVLGWFWAARHAADRRPGGAGRS